MLILFIIFLNLRLELKGFLEFLVLNCWTTLQFVGRSPSSNNVRPSYIIIHTLQGPGKPGKRSKQFQSTAHSPSPSLPCPCMYYQSPPPVICRTEARVVFHVVPSRREGQCQSWMLCPSPSGSTTHPQNSANAKYTNLNTFPGYSETQIPP